MMYGTYISVDQPAQRSSRKLPLVIFAAFAVVVCVALVTFHLDGHPTELEQRPRPFNFFTRDELQQLNHKLLPTMHLSASARKSRLSWRIENHPDPMEHKDMPLLAAVDLPAKPTTVPYTKPLIGDFDGDTAPSVGDPLGVKLPTQLTEVTSPCLAVVVMPIFVHCFLVDQCLKLRCDRLAMRSAAPFTFAWISSSLLMMSVMTKGFLKTAPLIFTFMGGMFSLALHGRPVLCCVALQLQSLVIVMPLPAPFFYRILQSLASLPYAHVHPE
jgi:hypothetical protein